MSKSIKLLAAIGFVVCYAAAISGSVGLIKDPALGRNEAIMTVMLAAAAAIVLVGIVLIVPDTNLDNSTTQGVALGVLSALLFTLRNLLHKHRFSHHSGPKAMFYQCLVAAVVLAPFQSSAALLMPLWGWGLLLVLGIGFTATPHALLAQALGNLKVKSVALISCLQPIYATVLAALVLHEIPDWRTLVGGVLVVSAAVFETLAARSQKP